MALAIRAASDADFIPDDPVEDARIAWRARQMVAQAPDEPFVAEWDGWLKAWVQFTAWAWSWGATIGIGWLVLSGIRTVVYALGAY